MAGKHFCPHILIWHSSLISTAEMQGPICRFYLTSACSSKFSFSRLSVFWRLTIAWHMAVSTTPSLVKVASTVFKPALRATQLDCTLSSSIILCLFCVPYFCFPCMIHTVWGINVFPETWKKFPFDLVFTVYTVWSLAFSSLQRVVGPGENCSVMWRLSSFITASLQSRWSSSTQEQIAQLQAL